MTMRIAVVNRHPSDTVGGSELQCDLFARGLTRRGHDVTYVALHADTSGADPEDPTDLAGRAGLPYAIVPVPSSAAGDARAIVDAIVRTDAEVVYWRYGRQLLDEVAQRLTEHDAPLVLAVAHVDDVSRWPSGPLAKGTVRDRAADVRRRIAHRRTWRAFEDVAAIAAQRADFVGLAPVALQQHVPNVVDPALEPFAWPRPYVAWVANVKARKRPELLAPLARGLADHGLDLLVVGGLQDERYRALMTPDPSLPNLHPLGLLAPPVTAGVIAGARCLAVTARPEGLSNAMIQAWWHGVPTVSFDYDPDATIVTHGLGAVSGGDELRFVDDVITYAADGEPSRTAGARARAHAQRWFAADDNVGLLEGLLRQVLERRR